MDKIWDRYTSPSRRLLAVVAEMKKRMTTKNQQKSNA